MQFFHSEDAIKAQQQWNAPSSVQYANQAPVSRPTTINWNAPSSVQYATAPAWGPGGLAPAVPDWGPQSVSPATIYRTLPDTNSAPDSRYSSSFSNARQSFGRDQWPVMLQPRHPVGQQSGSVVITSDGALLSSTAHNTSS